MDDLRIAAIPSEVLKRRELTKPAFNHYYAQSIEIS